jgi:hypothetical protein
MLPRYFALDLLPLIELQQVEPTNLMRWSYYGNNLTVSREDLMNAAKTGLERFNCGDKVLVRLDNSKWVPATVVQTTDTAQPPTGDRARTLTVRYDNDGTREKRFDRLNVSAIRLLTEFHVNEDVEFTSWGKTRTGRVLRACGPGSRYEVLTACGEVLSMEASDMRRAVDPKDKIKELEKALAAEKSARSADVDRFRGELHSEQCRVKAYRESADKLAAQLAAVRKALA